MMESMVMTQLLVYVSFFGFHLVLVLIWFWKPFFIMYVFGMAVVRIDFDRIEFERIDFS
jgi:hypothetical protein